MSEGKTLAKGVSEKWSVFLAEHLKQRWIIK